ncbi:MAG TPA: ABC-F family ATP-binding cassette domain-containing protein [Vitreimonas sp.]|uniref:ABC-F family ATP-binding cassette domain-containing protein n=1 Tax=Vitreimonas sp. TaxID=3069702 RepID=UPI002D47ED61|nr:ABC-F family ATP-binding cassette domain-containing protein [Vitreimonas sp.]HYD86164.1 ABC-F family ATP-binding cassette domain-containing protein [Vitreimonas sp.]
MPASITIANVSWATPDGRQLFSGLDLSFGPERAGLVGRNGVGKTTLLKLIAGELAPQSGTISVSGQLGVLRQIVQLSTEETIADLFGVRAALATLRRAESGEASAHDLDEADWTLEARMEAALARVGLAAGPETPLTALSGGQRTRASLAALVFAEPDFLLLDEPTNNLDRDGRAAVIDLLSGWRAGAIVISHDRELLERMDAIVELTSLGATRYGGGWSQYRARKALELAAAERDLADAEKRVTEVARSAQATRERQERRDAGGKRKGAKGDMPRILAGALKRAAENTTGANARLAERRRTEADADAADARARIEVLQPLAVTIPSTELAAGKVVLRLEHVSAGYAPGEAVLRDLSFAMTGPERVAVVGPNGSGKTTLLALVIGALAPWRGTVRVVTPFALLDQRVSLLDPALTVRENFLRINPEADENACRAALARFMFRADAALQIAGTLSGGQLLRAGLACVLGVQPPQLLMLDEPTNHLDIDSIEAVEAGLRAYDGALLVVSHDEAFLRNIVVTRRLELGSP